MKMRWRWLLEASRPSIVTLAFASLGCLHPPDVVAQPATATLIVSPASPRVGDNIGVSISSSLNCAFIAPTDGVFTAIAASVVDITLRVSCPLFPIAPLTTSATVGTLAAGTHSIRVFYQATIDGGATYLPLSPLASTSITVADTAAAVPTLGKYSLASVAGLIFVVAFLMRRHRPKGVRDILIALFLALPSWEAYAESTGGLGTDLAGRQVIVLYSPTEPTSPTIDEIRHAILDNRTPLSGIVGPALAARQTASTWLSAESRAELERDPLQPRALLERYLVLDYASPEIAVQAALRFINDKRVLSVEISRRVTFSAIPTDKFFAYSALRPYTGSYQWGAAALNLTPAWDRVRGSAYLAAVDNGIFCASASNPCQTHADLAMNFREHFSRSIRLGVESSDVDEPAGPRGHGTHVSGIISATPEYGTLTNGTTNGGVAGTCWTCSFAMLRFYSSSSWTDSAQAMTYGIDHGMQVLNLSWGDENDDVVLGYRFSSCSSYPYVQQCQAISYAAEKDVVLVAASGNKYEQRIQFPASQEPVIAVGGLETDSGFFRTGYGTSCTPSGPNCGSNYGKQYLGATPNAGADQVAAPAKDVVSTFYIGAIYNAPIKCADTYGPGSGVLDSGYGDCTGTSMATAFVTGIAGLARSADPLLSRAQIKQIVLSSTKPCTGTDATKCGAGVVDAAKVVNIALGGAIVRNRLTPLFSFYSAGANDHLYTVAPQMAVASMFPGLLLPQPPSGGTVFQPIGSAVPGYSSFPCTSSACAGLAQPRAMMSVYTTHVNPITGGSDLTPLYRLSRACLSACSHTSHAYAAGLTSAATYVGQGYKIDGIEGYIYSTSHSQPYGTVKLCRQYNSTRDDYILFPGTGSSGLTCGTGDGVTKNGAGIPYTDYSYFASGSDWIGWAPAITAPTAICGGGLSCSRLIGGLAPLLDD